MSAVTFEQVGGFRSGSGRVRTPRPTTTAAAGPAAGAGRAHRGELHLVPGEKSARPLHLTARGRRVVVALALVIACAAGMVGGRAMATAPETGMAVDFYTVGSGETLWSIAATLAEPGQDVRDVIAELTAINELPDSSLRVGQQLLVPVAAG